MFYLNFFGLVDIFLGRTWSYNEFSQMDWVFLQHQSLRSFELV